MIHDFAPDRCYFFRLSIEAIVIKTTSYGFASAFWVATMLSFRFSLLL